MEIIKINSAQPYNVYIGQNLFEAAAKSINELTTAKKLLILSDSTVFELYGEKLLQELKAVNLSTFTFVITPGEASKNADKLFELWNFLSDNGFSRSDAVLSLGGGVVSDLGGFAASTYKRGLDHFIFSTTLLSMADASVGGKTAINLNGIKNAAGTFYSPKAVFCDTSVLATLPKDIFNDGMAEIIKCGMINSKNLFSDILNGSSAEKLISQAVSIKKYYVEADETDLNLRHILNFGHTLGHAAEKLSNGEISHGRAVAAGMYAVTKASVKNGYCSSEALNLLKNLLDKFSLPTEFPFSLTELCKVAQTDKKTGGETLSLVIPTSVGKAEIHPVSLTNLYDFLS